MGRARPTSEVTKKQYNCNQRATRGANLLAKSKSSYPEHYKDPQYGACTAIYNVDEHGWALALQFLAQQSGWLNDGGADEAERLSCKNDRSHRLIDRVLQGI